MISSSTVSVFGLVTGNIAGFISKQYVLIHGLETIRKTIDEVVSAVAKEQFGIWIGTIFGHQASIVLTLPVASFIGDIVWGCVTEVVYSTVECSARTVGLVKPPLSRVSSAVLLAVRVVASMIAYTMKTCIIQYSFPYVQSFLEIVLPKLLPALCRYSIFQFYLQPFFAFGAAMVLTTPAVLLLADICGIIVLELLYFTGVRFFTKPQKQ